MSPRRSATPERSQRCCASPSGEHERAPIPALVLRRGAASHASPYERAGALGRGGGDQVLVLALEGGVGDLEDIEDTHSDVVGEMGKHA